MNRLLMENIVKHVLANLAVIPSSFVNVDKTKSLMTKEFLLHDKIPFENEGSELIENRIWGCQISAEEQELKLLLGDCTQEKNLPEYCLIVQLKNAPAYGVYLVYSDEVANEPLIACTLNGQDWLECQTYLQATFLAGMEQIRDIGLTWHKCNDYKEQFNMMMSFIKFHNIVYEAKYEGQENGF